MASYQEVAREIATQIATGERPEGEPMPALRSVAEARGASQATVLRAYRELAERGVIVTEARRLGHVAPGGALAAKRFLQAGAIFRLAGSDDPALHLLVREVSATVTIVSSSGSFGGLGALDDGSADGAAMHLWHPSGEYNAPYARGLLTARDPLLVHLWQREQGLVVAPGNPRRIRGIGDLGGLRVARRPLGTGTRALLERLARDASIELDVSDPEVRSHLDVALAVATGSADAGLALRGVADRFGLAFVSIRWEPFEVALAAAALGGLEPLLRALRDPALRARIGALGGYDLADAGTVRSLTS